MQCRRTENRAPRTVSRAAFESAPRVPREHRMAPTRFGEIQAAAPRPGEFARYPRTHSRTTCEFDLRLCSHNTRARGHRGRTASSADHRARKCDLHAHACTTPNARCRFFHAAVARANPETYRLASFPREARRRRCTACGDCAGCRWCTRGSRNRSSARRRWSPSPAGSFGRGYRRFQTFWSRLPWFSLQAIWRK